MILTPFLRLMRGSNYVNYVNAYVNGLKYMCVLSYLQKEKTGDLKNNY